MAKRFTDTEIWDKDWFMKLTPKLKCVIRFVYDKCDAAGVWQPNFALATLYVGEPVSLDDIKQLSCQLEILQDGKIFIPDFVLFQYGELTEKCIPHKKIISLLKKYNLFERVCIGYIKGSDTLKEKDKEKEEDKDVEKEKEKDREKKAAKKENKPQPVLFADTPFIDFDLFEAEYKGTDYEPYNLKFYYEAVLEWSKQGNKKVDWIATAKGFMQRDFKEGKPVLKNGKQQQATANKQDDRNNLEAVYAGFSQGGNAHTGK